ncbi:hypothetical protein [Delftia sp.]|uniref:hypothetical protein n=1 Tax=Delftia sp. TaxID=1886637 RepID=UPI00259CCA7C|nr:hypothetical protein [Delftia sp.]
MVATYPAFQYENVAFYASTQPQQGLDPVFRFFNTAYRRALLHHQPAFERD